MGDQRTSGSEGLRKEDPSPLLTILHFRCVTEKAGWKQNRCSI